MTVFKTPLQEERQQRDFAIYSDYERLMAVEGQSATEVGKHLMAKYNIHSLATIYVIRKRVEERLKKEATL